MTASPRRELRDWSLAARKSLGQHFLSDEALIGRIVALTGAGPDDVVVEIGPGLGAITFGLAENAAVVVAVEFDSGLAGRLESLLTERGVKNVEVTRGDAVGFDYGSVFARFGRRILVAGNLPYNITGPVFFDLLSHFTRVRRAALMVQEEVARRVASGPGGRRYGVLSVLLQAVGRVSMGERVGPDKFYPRPKVSSRMLTIDFADEFAAGFGELRSYITLVKAAFSKRRKTLLNALTGGLGRNRDEVAVWLEKAGIDPVRRAETLSPAEFGRLNVMVTGPGVNTPG